MGKRAVNKHHEELREKAKLAIDEVFSDTSVSQQVTKASLFDLSEHIEISIEALNKDSDR